MPFGHGNLHALSLAAGGLGLDKTLLPYVLHVTKLACVTFDNNSR